MEDEWYSEDWEEDEWYDEEEYYVEEVLLDTCDDGQWFQLAWIDSYGDGWNGASFEINDQIVAP